MNNDALINQESNSNKTTLPSYSLRERTSGAIYAGVPTVDLGLECSREDYTKKKNKTLDNAFSTEDHVYKIGELGSFCIMLDLGITKITDFETWSRTTIKECVLELQISVAYLLPRNEKKKGDLKHLGD